MHTQPLTETKQPRTHMSSGGHLLPTVWNRIHKLVIILAHTSSYIVEDFLRPDGEALSKRRLMLAPFALPLFLPRLAIKIIEDYHCFPLQERFRFTSLPENDMGLDLDGECLWELHPEEIIIEHNGNVMHGYYISCMNTKGYVVYCHGNAMTAATFANSLCRGEFGSSLQGYSIMAVEYPGYGKSSGAIYSDRDVLPVVELFFNKMVDIALLEGNGHLPMHVYGYSIGTGLAAYLAYKNKSIVEKIILHAPYYSLKLLARDYHCYLPVPERWLSYDFKTGEYLLNACNNGLATKESALKKYSGYINDFPPSKRRDPDFVEKLLSVIYKYNKKKILIFHSLHDELIPVTHSVKIQKLLLEAVLLDQQRDMEKCQTIAPPEHYDFTLYMQCYTEYVHLIDETRRMSGLNHSYQARSTADAIQLLLNQPLPINGICDKLKEKRNGKGIAVHQD